MDLNGQARGKRLPVSAAAKAQSEGTKLPYTVLDLDVWGEDIENSPLLFEKGDRDGVLLPTGRGPLLMPWLEAPAALLPMWMFHEDGRPYLGDPRRALHSVVQRYHERQLTPVVATELEFYLVDDRGDTPCPPSSPHSGKSRHGSDTLALQALDTFDAFFTALYDACAAMDIPADAAISEAGPGQFEVNLMHGPDAMKAADDAWLFKLLVKGLARRHGFAASFMAKPYKDHSGNGMHTHFSILDDQGQNIFDDGSPHGSATLRNAVAGCLATMKDATLVFAPHANSYERLVPERHAPMGIGWAYENRTAALRIPSGNPKARRIEHRVAGGDANPYLMIAVILGGALYGIEEGLTPPSPISGNAYAQGLEQIPMRWETALEHFEFSKTLPSIFDPHLIENYVRTKRQEVTKMADLSFKEQTDLYLDTV